MKRSTFTAGAVTSMTSLLLGALSGCEPHKVGNEWFPLIEGNHQRYDVHYELDDPRGPEIFELITEGTTDINGKQYLHRHHSEGVTYYFDSDEEGIRRVATRMDIDREPSMEPEPRWVLKAPYTVGTEWTTPTVPYLIQRINEHPRELKYTHKALMTWRIEAVDDEVILGDASKIAPCLRLRGEAKLNLYTDPVNGFTDVPLIGREWYCKNIGLVKFERSEKVPKGFLTGGTMTGEWLR